MKIMQLAGQPEDYNSIDFPKKITVKEESISFDGNIKLPANSFMVMRIAKKGK